VKLHYGETANDLSSYIK
jgi:hypothetical protein